MYIWKGILYSDYKEVEDWRWKNFTPKEVACPRTNQLFVHEPTMDAIQHMRDAYGRPINLNSAHRSWIHNIKVGGAARSAHLHLAFDISIPKQRGHRFVLAKLAEEAGFSSFGYGRNILHVDMRGSVSVGGRKRRWWYGKETQDIWGNYK